LVESDCRRIAYCKIGEGVHIFLCDRFRGILDTWGPAFVDGLAEHFTMITLDCGLGRSTGNRTFDVRSVADDAKNLTIHWVWRRS
jgi:hypothetical protein